MQTPICRVVRTTFLAVFALGVLMGCSHAPRFAAAVEALPPLPGVPMPAKTPVPGQDLLTLDDRMRRFLEYHVPSGTHPRYRLVTLHEALRAPLGLHYDPLADGSAREVFHRGTANCLGYAHLFTALAREVGLDAHYQWLEERPQWSRLGDLVARSLHVSVVIRLPGDPHYRVDFGPLWADEIVGSRLLHDHEAAALHYNNLAVKALEAGDRGLAWQQSIRALRLAPDMAQLWVNLGVLYRHVNREDIAEEAWLRAVALDSRERSAMNNLVSLYDRQGRKAERRHWAAALRQLRHSSPWYHAALGQRAGAQNDWQAALAHYQHALRLLPDDSRLLKEAALIERRLGNDSNVGAPMQTPAQPR